LQQRRQQQLALQLVGGDGDGGLQRRGVEALGGGKAAQVFQQHAGTFGQRLGTRRGHDAAAGLHHQRVAHDGTQLVQQVAHGRLRDAQAFGRARDRAFLHHRQQQLQQPAVEV
jgi:hypothetical protein